MSLPRLLGETHPPGSAGFRACLDNWFQGPLGAGIVEFERNSCHQVISESFGYHLVQLCPSAPLDLCDSSPIRHRILAGPSLAGPGQVRCALHDLPFATDSIDVLVLHHAIDFSGQPRGILREAARVLIPGGKLVIVGFNPVSLWGLVRLFRRRVVPVPWRGQFLSPSRLSDWLSVLDFSVDGYEGAVMGFPTCGAKVDAFNRWLDLLGNRFWNHLGAVYVLAAEKRVSRLTPVARLRSPARRAILMPMPVKTGTVSRTTDNRSNGQVDD